MVLPGAAAGATAVDTSDRAPGTYRLSTFMVSETDLLEPLQVELLMDGNPASFDAAWQIPMRSWGATLPFMADAFCQQRGTGECVLSLTHWHFHTVAPDGDAGHPDADINTDSCGSSLVQAAMQHGVERIQRWLSGEGPASKS
jgi:hypothetical protein